MPTLDWMTRGADVTVEVVEGLGTVDMGEIEMDYDEDDRDDYDQLQLALAAAAV